LRTPVLAGFLTDLLGMIVLSYQLDLP
jgi:hypothetical protein